MSKKSDKLIVIDCNAILHRAFHAYPITLTTRTGQPVNAIFGFTSILLELLKRFDPDYLIFTMDSKGKTFRHKEYPEYKANRPETDPLLVEQLEYFPEYIENFNLPALATKGYEADDIIGTIAASDISKGLETIIITGDKDLLQLLLIPETKVFLTGRSFSQSKLYDRESAKEKMGIDIKYLTDYKGLRGDPSDNIPGVAGIGDKSATKLINEYGNILQIYENIESIPPRMHNKLVDKKDLALQGKELTTLKYDVPMNVEISKANIKNVRVGKLSNLFKELEFYSLIKKLPKKQDNVKNEQHNFGLFKSNKNVDKEVKHIPLEFIKKEEIITTLKLIDEKNLLIELVTDQESSTQGMLLLDKDMSKPVIIRLDDIKLCKNELQKLFKSKILISSNAKKVIKVFFEFELESFLINDLEIYGFILDYDLREKNIFNYLLKNQDKDYSDEDVNFLNVNYLQSLLGLFISYGNRISRNSKQKNNWSQKDLIKRIELPLLEVLTMMEINGIKLDGKKIEKIKKELEIEIEEIKIRIYELSDSEFNLASPKQLGEVLFEKMKLPGAKKTKSGTYSTSERNLKDLRNDYEIVDLVLKYRELAKLVSTYTDALVFYIDSETSRIHSSFSQVVAATGRLASSEPNLQNIPISSKAGQRIRSAFVPEKGKAFLMLDYSQQELRLLAEFSKEEKLIEAFNGGVDIHALTASELMSKPVEKVSKDERRVGKTINFGIVYGMSPFGLADRLKIENIEAKEYIDHFFNSYPKVKQYFDIIIDKASRDGYVNSYFGRRREASGLHSSNYQMRRATEREVINFPLQGSAADMIKLSMVGIVKYINENYSDFAKLVLQIHDELVFEVETDDKTNPKLLKFGKDIKEMMMNVVDFNVAMKVDADFALNLANTERLII